MSPQKPIKIKSFKLTVNVSDHISIQEAVKSQTAIRRGIKNKPNAAQLKNTMMVANGCFEPLRNHHGKAIGVSSFFRSPELNKAIGGSKTSQHCAGKDKRGINAAAIDIDADIFNNGITNKEIFLWLKDNVEFDQLIWEYGSNEEPNWVHISLREHTNRKQMLKVKRVKGKPKYTIYK